MELLPPPLVPELPDKPGACQVDYIVVLSVTDPLVLRVGVALFLVPGPLVISKGGLDPPSGLVPLVHADLLGHHVQTSDF